MGDRLNRLTSRLKKKYRETKIRLKLSHYALKGSDFVRDAQGGFLLTRRSYQTDLPDFHRPVEEEHRAAILGRATEAEQLYVIARDLRQEIESQNSDLMRTIGEMARMHGYDAEMVRAIRILEEKYREEAIQNIRQRLKVSRKKWDDSAKVEYCLVKDPRLQWQMTVRTTARDLVRSDGDEPPHIQHAIDSAPEELLAQMANSERSVAMA